MMRIKLLLIVGLIYNLAYSQFNEPLTLPNYTPPSPDAFAITKYGDIPINEFTGMVNQTIPLYTYKAGQLKLPITINYTGAGVKVDDLPTWTGINWTLSAGGVITRNVNDIADESSSTRVTMSDADLQVYFNNTMDGTTEGQNMRDLIENGQIDSEADIFQFSFPEGSGSFYFDENFEPRQVKYDKELKIELTGTNGQDNKTRLLQNKEFVITNTEGVKYYFGGIHAIEESTRLYIKNGNLESSTSGGITSFFLTKIQHPLNGTIIFDYTENLPQKTIQTQKIQKIEKLIYNDNFDDGCDSESIGSTTNSSTTVTLKIVNPKYLVKISSINNSEIVNFNSNSIDNLHFKRVLNKIEVKKNSNITFKTIDFEYTPFTPSTPPFPYSDLTKRFFLTKIIFDKDNLYSPNTQSGRRNEVFTFEYNNYNLLPPRFSYSQDYLGYYNGKPNTSSIPNDSYFNPMNQPNFADRTPVFGYASCGTLTKIIYPTGGFTEFEYEANKAKVKNYKNINLYAYRNQTQYLDPNKLEASSFEVDLDGNMLGLNEIYEDQLININVTLIAGPANENSITPQNEKATLTIIDKTVPFSPSVISTSLIAMPSPSGNMNFNGYKEKSVIIPLTIQTGRIYEVKITINSVNSPPTPMEAFVNINYISGYTIVENLGVRLKKQTNYTSENFPENIKRYYYSKIDNLNPSLEDLPLYGSNVGKKYEYRLYNYVCQNLNSSSGGVHINVQKFLSLLSDKINLSYKSDYGNFEYVTVSYGGDNFENGGIEKRFQVSDDIGATQIDTKLNPNIYVNSNQELINPGDLLNTISNPYPRNGNLLKEKYFNSSLKKVIEKTYDYDFNQVHRLNNIIGKKEYDILLYGTGATTSNIVSNYTIGTYLTVSSKNEIIFEETKEYIDPVPLGVTDESIYDKIISTNEYDYDTLRGVPTIVTENNNNNVVETRYFYPNQVTQLTGLTQLQIDAVNELTNQFKITAPIQVEKYLNGNKQQTNRTLYKIFNNNPSNVFPEIIQSAKGTLAIEDRVKINKYDPFGNPSEVQLKDGSKTRYYYNNKNQVIGKIENFQISPTFPSGTEFIEITINTPLNQRCVNNVAYPNSIVTNYVYKQETDLLIQVIDTNCKTTYYQYNPLHRLENIKDDDGNIIKEFESNYKKY